jgi:hypothetical protein
VLVALAAASSSPAADNGGAAQIEPVPSLEPAATQALWRQLVANPRAAAADDADCRPLRAVFYAATDWMRLATKLAASGSPCGDYLISIPPLSADKTQPRSDQAWRIRALGPRFHALAEIHMGAWGTWVRTNGTTWYDAGVEARRRMAAAGYDVSLGDTWAVNEFSSAVRRGDGNARADAREFVRGLWDGDGVLPHARGAVFVVGIGQPTADLSTYKTNLQGWLQDTAFWNDMSAYVSDWSQELYGDVRNYAVPGATLPERRDALDAYLHHVDGLADVGPPDAAAARSFLHAASNPLANAAWEWDSAFGWTFVPFDQMQDYVSAQVYALRHAGAGDVDRFGFAWAPKNSSGLSAADFAAQSGGVIDRVAAAIDDSGRPLDPEDPGIGACAPAGTNAWCTTDVVGSAFNNAWLGLASWAPPTLALVASTPTVVAGARSSPLTVYLRTAAGAPLPAADPVTVTVSSSSATAEFSVDPAGPWTSTLTLSIPLAGTATASFHYRDPTAGAVVLIAVADGVTSGTLPFNVVERSRESTPKPR